MPDGLICFYINVREAMGLPKTRQRSSDICDVCSPVKSKADAQQSISPEHVRAAKRNRLSCPALMAARLSSFST